MKLAVVGTGIHGASTARSLAKRGHNVTLFEQFSLFHAKGSSHGESRIVRKAYPDAYYTALMAKAYPLWQELEIASGQKLVHEVGLTYFGNANSKNIETVVAGLSEVGEPHEVLDSNAVSRISPDARLEHDEVAVFTPAAGWVDASVCVRVSLELAKNDGVLVCPNTFVDRTQLEQSFDAYVVAPGGWIRDWVPDIDVSVSLQTVAFFEATITGPVWIDDSLSLAYGFPSVGQQQGAKVAYHSLGRRIDPNSSGRAPDDSLIAGLKEVLHRRFGQEDPKLVRTYGCLYTNTPDEDFRIGRVGPSGYFISACSGHGFKFGPWVGELMADLVETRQSIEQYPRFDISTPR